MDKSVPPPYEPVPQPRFNEGYSPYAPPHPAPAPATQPHFSPMIINNALPAQTSTNVVVVNSGGGTLPGCPACHNNDFTGTYSCCAWCLAICCFPVGILCCLCMRQKKCSKCGYVFG